MDIYSLLRKLTAEAFESLYNTTLPDPGQVIIEQTSPDFEGDFTIVVFPLLKYSRKSPAETAETLGKYLISKQPDIASYEVIKGYLNFTMKDNFWFSYLSDFNNNLLEVPEKTKEPQKILVEFSSPNTNKPLHLGHIRNNLLGNAISEILKIRGHEVVKLNLINDRGIHICKSMLAWLKYGNGDTPLSSGIKGDHFVGKYYVLFDKKYREQVIELTDGGMKDTDAEKQAPLMLEAQQMLRKWEEKEPEIIGVWSAMNGWTYEGFATTYLRMGISFDKTYYESDTYLLGKEIVKEGLDKGVFYKKEDGSVWVDLSSDGLDEKLLLRPDGTSVYITQDLGTAELKYQDYRANKSVYVVGDEQEYHFKVLKAVLAKLGKPYTDSIYHLSYGMVDLPEGKMKSREGKVVDADDLMAEMSETAVVYVKQSGKQEEVAEEELKQLSERVGLAALKFFILKTDARKRMVFNPEESIDLQGFTGPFVQYSYARIMSIFRKGNFQLTEKFDLNLNTEISGYEKDLIRRVYYFSSVIAEIEAKLDPSPLATYVYHLARSFNQFYHELPILKEPDENRKNFRLNLSMAVAKVIKKSLGLLGIEVVEKM